MRALPERQATLQTERLLLRPLQERDAERISMIADDAELVRYMSDSLPHPYTVVHAVAFIAASHRDYREQEDIEFAITLREDESLIGLVGMDLNTKDDHVTLGYWIGKPWWGRGYMSEAVREIVRYSFEELELHRVASHHFHPNTASGKVLQKAGLKYEGRRKEHYKKGDRFFDIIDYGVVRSEWEG